MSIEEIKNRHINKSWKVGEYSTDYYKQGYQVLTENDGVVAECIDDSEEAEFIAHAPADIAYLLEQNQRLAEALEKARDKSQILASHCAVQLDRGGNVGSAYAFEKSQEIYELLRDKLLEKKKGEKEMNKTLVKNSHLPAKVIYTSAWQDGKITGYELTPNHKELKVDIERNSDRQSRIRVENTSFVEKFVTIEIELKEL